MSYILFIKNAVCNRCVLVIESILKQLQIPYSHINIGEAHLLNDLDESSRLKLQEQLEAVGLSLVDTRLNQLIEKIKILVLQKARNEVNEHEKRQKLSHFIIDKLPMDYSYLSNLFSSIEGRTIEKYFIVQRIEKAKELLVYGELTLSEISYELNYSSVAHLSTQFKKVTGLTPTYFKHIGNNKLKPLDQI